MPDTAPAPTPDASMSLVAELNAGVWSLFTVPTGAHSNSDRTFIGSGRAGSGIMFPTNILSQAWQQSQAAS